MPKLVRDTAAAWQAAWLDASSAGHVCSVRNLQYWRKSGDADFIPRQMGGTVPSSVVAGLEIIQARYDERAAARAAYARFYRWPLHPDLVGGASSAELTAPSALVSFDLRAK
jgi:hypothetical protein